MSWHMVVHVGYDANPTNHRSGNGTKEFHIEGEIPAKMKEELCQELAKYYAPTIREAVKKVNIETFADGDCGPTSLKPIETRYDVKVKMAIELHKKDPNKKKGQRRAAA